MIKDKIFNFFLNLYVNIVRRFTGKIKPFPPTHNYYISHVQFFKGKDFLSDWMTNLWWGSHKDNEKLSYRDPSCVIIGDHLSLTTVFKPKINEKNGATMKFAEGCIQKLEPIRNYGAIEVKVILHPAKAVWHAPLWFVAANPIGAKELLKVLPEIDVSEIYSGSNAYKMKSNSNLHHGTDYEENSKSIGAHNNFIPNVFSREISFSLIWEKDFLTYYIDGWLVRKITDKNILNRLKDGILPIIGSGVNPKYPEEHEASKMDVISFKYWES